MPPLEQYPCESSSVQIKQAHPLLDVAADKNYQRIPPWVICQLIDYVILGTEPCHLLRIMLDKPTLWEFCAALQGCLSDGKQSQRTAEFLTSIDAIYLFIYNRVPSNSFGTPVAVYDWMIKRGEDGPLYPDSKPENN